jgi:hypothetical protein
MIAELNFGRKVRCHIGVVEIPENARAIMEKVPEPFEGVHSFVGQRQKELAIPSFFRYIPDCVAT